MRLTVLAFAAAILATLPACSAERKPAVVSEYGSSWYGAPAIVLSLLSTHHIRQCSEVYVQTRNAISDPAAVFLAYCTADKGTNWYAFVVDPVRGTVNSAALDRSIPLPNRDVAYPSI